MTAFNGNYDSTAVGMILDPQTLVRTVGSVREVVDRIVTSVVTINKTLGALKLSWVGRSASEAQSFADRWNTAMTSIFGQNNDPGWGVLNRLLDAVAIAGANYSETEGALIHTFQTIAASLGTTGPGNNPPPYAGTNDQHMPIYEVYGQG